MPTATLPTTDLKSLARDMRVDIIRMIEAAGSGHPGGSLSIIDILAVLYTRFLRHDPKRTDWPRNLVKSGFSSQVFWNI